MRFNIPSMVEKVRHVGNHCQHFRLKHFPPLLDLPKVHKEIKLERNAAYVYAFQ